MTTVVYTAIYGGYDEPKPLPPDLDCAAVLVTDSDATAALGISRGWRPLIIPHRVATTNGDPAKLAPMLAHKWWKTHPQALATLGGLDIALWVDGSIELATPDYVALCARALGRDDLALCPHPWRDCAIAEGEYSATLPRYQQTPVGAQTAFYERTVAHPRGWGLFASGVLAWRLTPATAAFGEWWWRECLTWSHQDQVSLPVLLRLSDKGELEGTAGMGWNRNLGWEQWWRLHHHAVAP
jgi:hypothetical protein